MLPYILRMRVVFQARQCAISCISIFMEMRRTLSQIRAAQAARLSGAIKARHKAILMACKPAGNFITLLGEPGLGRKSCLPCRSRSSHRRLKVILFFIRLSLCMIIADDLLGIGSDDVTQDTRRPLLASLCPCRLTE